MQNWERYSYAARAAIKAIADDLGLESVVDAKKEFQGEITRWEIDVAAYAKGSGELVVFECRKTWKECREERNGRLRLYGK